MPDGSRVMSVPQIQGRASPYDPDFPQGWDSRIHPYVGSLMMKARRFIGGHRRVNRVLLEVLDGSFHVLH